MSDDEILFETRGPLAVITLNRPAQLNALTQSMIRALDARLQLFEADPAVKAIAIRGAGERAFCAGGDIRWLYDNGPEKKVENFAFYLEEYRLNRRIKRLKTPFIALTDGVTMGGGVGVSIHGRYRVGGEKLMFAMPEVGIGFVPDVGASFFLPRLPRRIGWWLGVSGARLNAGDAMFAHVIDYYLRSNAFDIVLDRLAAADYGADDESADQAICEILAEAAAPAPASALKDHAVEIEAAFEQPSIDAAVAALANGGDWARAQAAEIAKKSPMSVAMTWRMLHEGLSLSFEDGLRLEYRLARERVGSADFREGVRAAIIDKDHAPTWSPATLGEVSSAALDAAFAPLGAEELSFPEDGRG